MLPNGKKLLSSIFLRYFKEFKSVETLFCFYVQGVIFISVTAHFNGIWDTITSLAFIHLKNTFLEELMMIRTKLWKCCIYDKERLISHQFRPWLKIQISKAEVINYFRHPSGNRPWFLNSNTPQILLDKKLVRKPLSFCIP